jgi:Ca2+-binding RTX toxin-like protein
LNGGDGSDSYQWSKGDGSDTISDDGLAGETDRLVLADVASSEVKLWRANGSDDLKITIIPTGEIITDQGPFGSPDTGIDAITFADGVTWTLADLLANTRLDVIGDDRTLHGTKLADNLFGHGNRDTLIGNDGDDLLVGGSKLDNLQGGNGNDTYVWFKNHGNDTIGDTGGDDETDRLELADLASTDIELYRVNGSNDLKIYVIPTGETITDVGRFNSPGTGIDAIKFSDGVTWTFAEMLARTGVWGTSSAETLTGTGFTDNLLGGAGNDTLTGNDGDDYLDGGDGNDTLHGGKGNDLLEGAEGNDTLNGDEGDDTLRGGDGDDTLNGGSGDDTLKGGTGNDTLNGNDGDDTLNGDDGADWLYGDDGNDDLDGGTGGDTLNGGDGNDYLEGGDGNDTLNAGSSCPVQPHQAPAGDISSS